MHIEHEWHLAQIILQQLSSIKMLSNLNYLCPFLGCVDFVLQIEKKHIV